MQLAPVTHNLPSFAEAPTDIVSPSSLFEIAGDRLGVAIKLIEAPGEGLAANAPAVRAALAEAQGGVRALRSVLVPTTPLGQRALAASAIDAAVRGIDALTDYEAVVAPLGSSAVERDMLAPAALEDLSTGYLQLLAAVARIAPVL